MTEPTTTTAGRRPDPPDRLGGTRGNERLTAGAGAVLFLLLAGLGVTIPDLHSLLREHVFLGMLLIPPVLLKLGSTGYRFVRYYTRSPAYRQAGPPQLLMRLVAPVVVAATLAVFGSGVLLLVVGQHDGLLRNVHKIAFIVWFAATGVHVLAYIRRVPGLATADWTPAGTPLGGSLARRLLVGGALASGLVLASLTVQYA